MGDTDRVDEPSARRPDWIGGVWVVLSDGQPWASRGRGLNRPGHLPRRSIGGYQPWFFDADCRRDRSVV